MAPDRDQTGTPAKADHLCVLVHGLWGNPSHMDFLASRLRERYDEDRLYILAAEKNSGNLTYDGVQVCGERLAHEIEETLERLEADGHKIKKLSVVGYSLGGLIARYALGLLYSQGWLDKLEPTNFTTFASPHLGVRAPVRGAQNLFFNGLGSRTVSVSGQHLFLTDTFRDSGKPLLRVLAEPDSIFIQGLSKFKNRCVYGNVVNDRTTPFYTTIFTSVDHFLGLEDLNINYVEGYESVIVDPELYTLPAAEKPKLPFFARVKENIRSFFRKLPFWLLFSVVLVIAVPIFLGYAVVQTFRSRDRLRAHEESSQTIFKRYRVPVAVKRVRTAMDEVFENAAARQDPDYLSGSAVPSDIESQPESQQESSIGKTKTMEDAPPATSAAEGSADQPEGISQVATYATANEAQKPTLALTPDQFSMIKSLNRVGFRKYPVYIHNHRHSHAAIVVRMDKEGFEEGHTVVKHWLDNEFEL
ncbi:putative serine esterase-domain-containing protein [Aspergillus pseudoustus]|uniref:Serine esterase-domain-containing protein n=1 Tax=Aspergillus pseudoustus TaxID=1810923 RepID=A0ABR4JG73_9EURO